MKIKNQNKDQSGTVSEDRAQLILIGGLVVAVAVVAIALVIGGGLFSQSTTDDGGLSSFASQTADQVQTAATVGQKDLEYANENSTLYEGAYPDELCGELVNSTEVQQLVATQLGEGESVANVQVKQDCEKLKNSTSWLTGQTEEKNLPSVNVSEPVETTVKKTCSILHLETGYANEDVRERFVDQLVDYYGSASDIPDDLVSADPLRVKLELEDVEDNTDDDTFSLDPIIDDDEIDVENDYIKNCIELDIKDGRLPADIVFAIDTSGSMDSPNKVTGSWQTSPHGDVFPSEDLTSTHRPDTGVTIPDDWIDTTTDGSWDGTSDPSDGVGDMVCLGAGSCSYVVNVTGSASGSKWDVETSYGATGTFDEAFLYEMKYRLNAPERMWYTQVGLKEAVDDLNTAEPDRAGLIKYDTSQNEEASVEGVDNAGHRNELKVDTDGFYPGGGTDIAEAMQESKDIIERDYVSSSDATKNIVILSDGEHNPTNGGYSPCGPANAYDCSIDGNQDAYDDIYIHSVILGSSAADNVDAVSDMAKITNAEDSDVSLSNSDVDKSDLPDRDDPRPNGTLIASDDPSDAEDLFDDIIGSIEDNTDIDDNATAGTPDPDKELNATITSSSGTVEEIYDMRMNVSHFTGNGSYVMKFTDTDASDNEVVAWQMKVNNTFVGPSSPTPSVGYKVNFTSETNPTLDETIEVPASEGNISSSSDNYVWIDLTGKGSKPRLEVGSLGSIGSQLDDFSGSEDYMSAAWAEVQNEMESGSSETDFTPGVAIVAEELNPFGEVNGTFSMEFEPKDGDFTKVGGIEGGDFGEDCSGGTGSLPKKCGLEDPENERGAVSTAQIKEADIIVTVEGPEGRSNKTVKIPPEGKYSYDIFE